jgi:hypothetical protein
MEKDTTLKELSLTLIVSGLTVEDAQKLAHVIYEIDEADPTKQHLCVIRGLEVKTSEEAKRILNTIFPRGGVAS